MHERLRDYCTNLLHIPNIVVSPKSMIEKFGTLINYYFVLIVKYSYILLIMLIVHSDFKSFLAVESYIKIYPLILQGQ
jgi:hypothetical protein